MNTVDLNADVGEWEESGLAARLDAALIPLVSSVNVACGGHAGNAFSMSSTVRLALVNGLSIGAHPSLPDRDHFGRRELPVTVAAVDALIRTQVTDLIKVASALGGVVRHVKPHGALYNLAARDRSIADAIATAVATIDPHLVLVGLSGSELLSAGTRAGLRTASEGFADRGYDVSGSLLPRSHAGAVVHDALAVGERAVRMVREGRVIAAGGQFVPVTADTICIHSDTPDAVELARAVRAALERAGIGISPCS
ncbi:MAG TPA: 5-oxoprolinase subunit PxpA [Vicinamibacterales bacterium]|nr:5-oxoprolinase subunit PxpA [Vicinamibacterales bacterium]